MSGAMPSPAAVRRPAINPWIVAIAVVIPTFMETLDTTIAQVALRYIAGGISAANVDSEWVLTSYLAANATILPISGWLSARLGRRNYFLLSIALFTIASGLCGMATSRGADARWLVAGGLLVMAAGCYWMALMNIYISPDIAIWPRIVTICGLSMIFAPLNVAAFKYTPQALRGAAVGLFALLRNEGGSAGTSMSQIIEERRLQFHVWRVGEFLDPLNSHVNAFIEQASASSWQQTGDAAASQQLALQALEGLRQQQAVSLAWFDVFWVCAVLGLALVFLVVLMKRSVAAKSAHIGAE